MEVLMIVLHCCRLWLYFFIFLFTSFFFIGMEVLMIVLQFLVVVCGFIWGSAYSLTFHPRALVPRFTSTKVLASVQKGKY